MFYYERDVKWTADNDISGTLATYNYSFGIVKFTITLDHIRDRVTWERKTVGSRKRLGWKLQTKLSDLTAESPLPPPAAILHLLRTKLDCISRKYSAEGQNVEAPVSILTNKYTHLQQRVEKLETRVSKLNAYLFLPHK